MAAPSGIVWGSIVGDYGRIGIYYKFTDTNTTRKVDIEVWFKSKYSINDSSNIFYYDRKLNAGEATTKRTISAIKTTVATGNGWSTSNEVKLWSDSHTYTLGTSSSTIYLAAKLADVDRVGGTMYIERPFTVPALAKYTISYNANGGTGAPSAQTKYYGKSLTLSSTTPTRTGYSFVGWALTDADADDGKYYYLAGGTCGKNENLTLYAVWKANTYTVKFDANGGTGAPSNQTKTYGVTLKLSTTKPSRTNYNFLGWSTSKTATSATYSAGGNYTTNSATTLYAVWELAYVRPRVIGLSGARCSIVDGEPTIDEEGTSALIAFDYACDQPISSITIEWESVKNSGSISVGDIDGQLGNVSQVIGDNLLDTDVTYTIRITVTDANGYTSVTATLNGLLLAIDVLPGNKGISFGKPAELEDHADFNYTIYPRKGFKNVPIDKDMDLNDLIIPNTYISQDKVTSTYLNCPVKSGTFTLDVSSAGIEGQVRQIITYTSKDNPLMWMRYRYSDTWGDWYEVGGLKSAMTVGLSSNVTLGALNTYTQIPFDKSITSIGNGLSLSGGSVVIGPGVRYVNISAITKITCGTVSGNRHCRLCRSRNGEVSYISWITVKMDASDQDTIILPSSVISVEEGDQLYMVFYTSDTADYHVSGGTNGCQTYMTVQSL